MSGITKLMTAGGGGVALTPASSIASDVTVQIPSVNGTLVVSGQNSAITAGTAQASTSGTSIDFTGIPSWVKRITVMFSGVSLSSTATPLIQLGTSGGIDSSSYKSQSYFGGGSSAGATNGFLFGLSGGNAANTHHGSYVICLVSGNSYVGSGVMAVLDNNTGVAMAGGSKSLSGTLDRIRITSSSGTDTFDAGSINILYE